MHEALKLKEDGGRCYFLEEKENVSDANLVTSCLKQKKGFSTLA